MHASPIQQGIWTLLAALLLALPMYLLTRPATVSHAAPPVQQAAAREEAVECLLTVRCASLPESLVIKHGDQVIFDLAEQSGPGLRMEEFVFLPVPTKGGLKLNVRAEWTGGSDNPVTLVLEPDMKKAESETKWSHGRTLNDIYTFSW